MSVTRIKHICQPIEASVPGNCSTCFLASLDESRAGFGGCERSSNGCQLREYYLQQTPSCHLHDLVSMQHRKYVESRISVVPMVSSTSAARGAVVAKARALGTRRDRAAARNSCGRMIARVSIEKRGGEGRNCDGVGRGGGGRSLTVQSSESVGLHNAADRPGAD